MKKRAVTIVLCLALALFSVLRAYAEAGTATENTAKAESTVQGIVPAGIQEFDVPCAAAILIDEDSGTVLYEKTPTSSVPLPPSPR